MLSPETVSLQIPYTSNEKKFLILAVQVAVRRFRSINPRCADDPHYLSSPSPSAPSSPSGMHDQHAMHKNHV
jgi:hypothetical protein